MNKIPEISVFFPAYNEEKNIEKTVQDSRKILEKIASKYEILIIDDGSKDKTGEIADQLAKFSKDIKVIHHHLNQGYGAALKSGFTNARYNWIATIDADGQFDFSEIEKLYEKTFNADVVIGFRLNRQDPLSRKINGWLWTFLNNLLFGINVKDVDCAFKLVNKKVIEKISPLESTRGGMISPELLAKAKKAGFKIDQVGVHHYPRKEGQQTGANLKVVIKSFVDLFRLWLKLNRNYLPIILILLIAAFVRLYRISDYMTFLGDEGRDALVWLRIIRDGKFTLLGPMTSIGNMYLGPLYYYLMLPFFIIFQSPIGPSVGVALFSVLTVYMIWLFGKEWFDEKTGLIAAFLYSISPVIISLSRSSWNPNIMPFFALLTIWGVWQFWQKKKWIWLPIIGTSLSFAIQSHYLGLLLIPVVGIFWLATFKNIFKDKKTLKKFFLYSFLLCCLLFVLSVLPLVWFDFRHNFINFNAFKLFFTDRQATVNFKIYKAIPNLGPLWGMMVTRMLTAKDVFWGRVVALVFIPFLIFVLTRSNLVKGLALTVSQKKPLILILVWLGIGLVGLGVYKQHIYDHYFGFLFPAVFLLAGFLLNRFISASRILKIIGIFALLLIVWLNLSQLPIKDQPNSQLKRVQEVDRLIIQQAKNKPFNFSLIAKQNYDAGYGYYLEYWNHKPVPIDPQRFQQTVTDQLFVVCEDLPCQPVNNPNAGIANFGWSKIEEKWTAAGVEIYKLVHNYPLADL